ncbi:MAG: hypothetical protein U0M82_10030, partial [Bilophila wadsworthia]
VDLVVEGDGIAFARALAQELGGRVREHRTFMTALIIYHDENGEEQRLDVATARLEYYKYPAALPTVELSSIKMDLFRRDFTITQWPSASTRGSSAASSTSSAARATSSARRSASSTP